MEVVRGLSFVWINELLTVTMYLCIIHLLYKHFLGFSWKNKHTAVAKE